MSKKIIFFIIIVLVIIAGIYFFFPRTASYNLPTSPATTSGNQVSTNTPASPAVTAAPSLKNPVSPQTYAVSIINFSFNPGTLNINKGDTVVWTDNDSVPHQVAGANFTGPVMSHGSTYTQTFNESGTVDYHCNIHPSMKGTIIVK